MKIRTTSPPRMTMDQLMAWQQQMRSSKKTATPELIAEEFGVDMVHWA